MQIQKKYIAKNTPYKTPYYLISGNDKGDTVIITAGVHGNERASIRAAFWLLNSIQKRSIIVRCGQLIIVPVVNQMAYERRIRGVPDLNRTFPRGVTQEAKHPLSSALFQLAKEMKPLWYIDLHEANGIAVLNPKMLGQTLIAHPGSKAVPPVDRIIRRINRTIPMKTRHFKMRLSSLPGSGRNAAKQLIKAKAITVETSLELPISTRIQYQKQILQYLLKEANIT
ncbi:succinylglutamate desuccinylase/aspartoacylase family protein [Paenibacillus glycanilyticus]|uniref:succinylglutamate desuccinylase/aspartoacylase family protein n=1 Tax=Paenibacillus glycanilyticus TaxID=126569 RepID=UPI000FD8E51A|nr:succinylglutamate desuccinylase/aspartoacylase family protein [Paenibacillus glycanilyticus]